MKEKPRHTLRMKVVKDNPELEGYEIILLIQNGDKITPSRIENETLKDQYHVRCRWCDWSNRDSLGLSVARTLAIEWSHSTIIHPQHECDSRKKVLKELELQSQDDEDYEKATAVSSKNS